MHTPKKNICSIIKQHCLLCDAVLSDNLNICEACRADLPWLTHQCERCALPLANAEQHPICAQCQASPPSFDSVTSVFRYAFPIDKLLQKTKLANNSYHLNWLAACLYSKISLNPLPEAIIFVPHSKSRLLSKGYNQGEYLAVQLARLTQLEIAWHVCRKHRETQRQSDLSGKSRRQNLKHAFQCPDHNYRHLAIVDDTMTTGATVSEISTELKKSGAHTVDIWVLARTASDHHKTHRN
ncbi:MAG: ComF family protein [Pseudomonadales bacterium]